MDKIVLNERYGCMEVLDLGEEYNEKHSFPVVLM